LPANDDSLENLYSAQDEIDVAVENDDRVSQLFTGTDYGIHQFSDWVGNESHATLTWIGQVSISPQTSTVYLQIYNHDTDEWDTLTSNNTASADTDFEIEYFVSDLTDYERLGFITCRVYQQGV
jgi:hypothetical protein